MQTWWWLDNKDKGNIEHNMDRFNMDNKDKGNIEHNMDRFNKLWRTIIIQGWTAGEDEQQQAAPARGFKSEDQPAPQERNLTHLPFRSWCKHCVQNKSKSDAHPKQQCNSKAPVTSSAIWLLLLQVTRWTEETPIGSQQQDPRLQLPRACIQSFLMECGRGTCSTQQHCTTIRSRGTSYITTKRNSSKAWKQHCSPTFTSILIAITRNCWKIWQNIDGAS